MLEWLKKKSARSPERLRPPVEAGHPELSLRRQCALPQGVQFFLHSIGGREHAVQIDVARSVDGFAVVVIVAGTLRVHHVFTGAEDHLSNECRTLGRGQEAHHRIERGAVPFAQRQLTVSDACLGNP